MNMYDPLKFRIDIIKPALLSIELYSQAAEDLLLGTALKESNLIYTHQIGGPALGYFQMEPNTYGDIFENYLKFRPNLLAKTTNLVAYGINQAPNPIVLESNHKFAAAMCRIKYARVPKPLPLQGDVIGMANYWKTYYNTGEGAGTIQEFVDLYNKYNVNSDT